MNVQMSRDYKTGLRQRIYRVLYVSISLTLYQVIENPSKITFCTSQQNVVCFYFKIIVRIFFLMYQLEILTLRCSQSCEKNDQHKNLHDCKSFVVIIQLLMMSCLGIFETVNEFSSNNKLLFIEISGSSGLEFQCITI